MSNPESSPDFFAVEIFWTIKTLRAFFMLVHACSHLEQRLVQEMYIHKFYTVLKGGTCRLHQFHTAHRMRQHPLFTCVGEKKHPGGNLRKPKVNWQWTGKSFTSESSNFGGKKSQRKKTQIGGSSISTKKKTWPKSPTSTTNSCMFFFFWGGGGWDEYLSCKISDESPSRSCRSCDGDSRLFCSLDLSDGTEEPSAPSLQAKWSKWWRCGEKEPFIFLGLLFVPLPWVILRFPSRNQGINLLTKMRGCLPVNTTPCQLYKKKVYRHGH